MGLRGFLLGTAVMTELERAFFFFFYLSCFA
jgi:hypothetical protein